MAENRWGDGRRPVPPAPGEFVGGRQRRVGSGNPGGREIDDALAQHRPQTEIVDGLGDRVLVKVAVAAGGGAREGHLGAGQQSAPAHGFRGDDGAFGRKNVRVQPSTPRGRSSASPRKSVIGRWVWVLTSPGMTIPPRASIIRPAAGSPAWPGPGPRAWILPPAIPIQPPGIDVKGRAAGENRTVVDEGVEGHASLPRAFYSVQLLPGHRAWSSDSSRKPGGVRLL